MILLRFQGGATWLSKQELAERFVEKHKHNHDKWLEIAELMRADLGNEIGLEDLQQVVLDWAKHDAVTKRGVYATCLDLELLPSIHKSSPGIVVRMCSWGFPFSYYV